MVGTLHPRPRRARRGLGRTLSGTREVKTKRACFVRVDRRVKLRTSTRQLLPPRIRFTCSKVGVYLWDQLRQVPTRSIRPTFQAFQYPYRAGVSSIWGGPVVYNKRGLLQGVLRRVFLNDRQYNTNLEGRPSTITRTRRVYVCHRNHFVRCCALSSVNYLTSRSQRFSRFFRYSQCFTVGVFRRRLHRTRRIFYLIIKVACAPCMFVGRFQHQDNRYLEDQRVPMGEENSRVCPFIHTLYARSGDCRWLR